MVSFETFPLAMYGKRGQAPRWPFFHSLRGLPLDELVVFLVRTDPGPNKQVRSLVVANGSIMIADSGGP